MAFAHLVGVVRHFHPSDEAASASWDELVTRGVAVVETARGPAELARRLQEVVAPVGPTVRVYPADRPPADPPARPGPRLAWRHRGVALGFEQKVYSSERRATYDNDLRPWRKELGAGVAALVPLAVEWAGGKTLPRASAAPPPRTALPTSARERPVRLAAVILAWNVLQHFFPYFEEAATDWEAALREALARASGDADEIQFLDTLRVMLARLHDGHGEVILPGYQPCPARPPLTWNWIDGALVVAGVQGEAGTAVAAAGVGVEPGDEIIEIDGHPVKEVMARVERTISGATPQLVRFRALPRLAAGPRGSQVALTVVPRGRPAPRQIVLSRSVACQPFLTERRPEPLAELEPGIRYVDLTRVSEAQLAGSLSELVEARGIVFDVRGYPEVGTRLLEHLLPRKARSPVWLTPIFSRPDRAGVTLDRGQWTVQPTDPRIAAPAVYLADGRAFSWAETLLSMVQSESLGIIVGETTGGTNGNTNSFLVPGGYYLTFTGMKVLRPDGGRHHGVGITPGVRVSPTRDGLAAGRDQILERGLAELTRAM